jgi:hypothetical protein
MDTTTSVATAPVGPGFSLQGLLEVLFAPTKFFGKLKDNPKILVPYLVLVGLAFVYMVGIGDIMLKAQLKAMQDLGQPTNVVPAEVIKWSGIGSFVLAIALMPLVTAALGMFWGNLIFGYQASYRQLLSMVLYTEIIFAVGMLATLPLVLAKQSLAVSYSLAVLVADQGPESFAYQALSRVGVFYFWEWIVAGIGFSVIYGVSRNKGMILSVLSVVLLSVFAVLAALAGQAMR